MTLSLHEEGARAGCRRRTCLLLNWTSTFRLLHVPVKGRDMLAEKNAISYQLCLNMGLLLQARLSTCLRVLRASKSLRLLPTEAHGQIALVQALLNSPIFKSNLPRCGRDIWSSTLAEIGKTLPKGPTWGLVGGQRLILEEVHHSPFSTFPR